MIVNGIDTLEFGLEIVDYSIEFKSMLEVLSVHKQLAQESNKEIIIELNDINFTVSRTGIKFYQYSLSCNDFFIYFMEKTMNTNSPIKVKFLASYIWSYGYNKAIENFMTWFSHFGLKIVETKLSRLDICVDSDEFTFSEKDLNGVITRARDYKNHYVDTEYFNGRQFSGFSIGSGNPIIARIYNKTLEIKKSQKFWFHDVWNNYKWDKEKDVWRTEFQLRRPVLKEFNIKSLDDIFNNLNGLWIYLTHQWLTLRTPQNDTNTSRWPVNHKWLKIQNAEINQTDSILVRNKVKKGNSEQLLNQIGGLLITLGALNDLHKIEHTLELSRKWIVSKLLSKNLSFENEVNERKNRFIISKEF